MSDSAPIAYEFTANEWNILKAGLLELPGKVGLPVLVKLEQQQQAAEPQKLREVQ